MNNHIPNPTSPLANVSRETFAQLETYSQKLTEWNRSINLVAPSTLTHLWERHIEDCAQLVHYLPNKNSLILDMGSGAGLPGIILSLMGYNNMHLVESDRRKALFLNEAALACGISPTIYHARLENIFIDDTEIITARALAPLHKLIGWAVDFIPNKNNKNAFCLFPKGENWCMEIEEAQQYWAFSYEDFPSVTDKKARIIKILIDSVSSL